MESKIYLNVIKTLTPTYIDLISSWSAGECTMSNLLTFERILSICLRDGIIEDNELYQKTEKDLGTHDHYQENDPVDHAEFNLWLITYEQIMRDEGLIGNTGTGEDDKDKESVFFDPFITPFVRKKGAEVSLSDPADDDADTFEDGADEESCDEDRASDDSGDESGPQDGGKPEESDHPEIEEEEDSEEVVQEEDQSDDEVESTDEFQSLAFNLDKLEPDDGQEDVDESDEETVEPISEETDDEDEDEPEEEHKSTPYVPVEDDFVIRQVDSDTGEPLPTSNRYDSKPLVPDNSNMVLFFDEFGKPLDIRPIILGMRAASEETVEPLDEETFNEETDKPASCGLREADDQ